MYEYRASTVRVVDGDTVDLLIDLGFGVSIKERVRLSGINAPERNTPDGPRSTETLRSLLFLPEEDGGPMPLPLIVHTSKDRRDKWQRFLALIYIDHGGGLSDSPSINDQMVELGAAEIYGP